MGKGRLDTSLLVSDKASSRSVFVKEEDVGEFEVDFGLSRGRGKTLSFRFCFWVDIGGGVGGGVKISLLDLNGVSPSFLFVFLVDAAARWNMNMSSRIFNTNAKEVVVTILHC